MACCDDCENGMGNCGSGLGELMGDLAAGSRVRVGFEFDYSGAYNPDEIEGQLTSYIQNALYNYLADGVTFSDVRVSVSPPGYFSSGYITVEATTRTPLPTPNSFGDMVAYGIAQYLPRIVATRRDETLVDSYGQAQTQAPGLPPAGVPQVCSWDTMDFRDYLDCQLGIGKFANRSGTQAPQVNTNPQAPSAPGACNWSQMSFGDYVACQLGIKSAVGGIAAGATGALVGVAAITILAVVLLKR